MGDYTGERILGSKNHWGPAWRLANIKIHQVYLFMMLLEYSLSSQLRGPKHFAFDKKRIRDKE